MWNLSRGRTGQLDENRTYRDLRTEGIPSRTIRSLCSRFDFGTSGLFLPCVKTAILVFNGCSGVDGSRNSSSLHGTRHSLVDPHIWDWVLCLPVSRGRTGCELACWHFLFGFVERADFCFL